MARHLGDFQTPIELARACVAALETHFELTYHRVFEPTCGIGNFLAAVRSRGVEMRGVELQPEHLETAQQRLPGAHLELGNIFDRDMRSISWHSSGPLLVLGNPPWVTNAELGVLGSGNRPKRENLSGASGLNAKTGAANFDLAEAVWLKVLREFAAESPTIAFLCKVSVAHRVLRYCQRAGVSVKRAAAWNIDGKRWFDAAVRACLFALELDAGADRGGEPIEVPFFDDLACAEASGRWRIEAGRLIADCQAYDRVRSLDGISQLTWRQGVKHDLAGIMELSRVDGGGWQSREGGPVSVEATHRYPLVKATDLHRGRSPTRQLIITQTRLKQDTARLAREAPDLWRYLNRHRIRFGARKSSIYRGHPNFALFGIGDYTFTPFKIAVSGLHRSATFRLLTPHDDRPVVCDDTCYLAPFESLAEAALVTAALNHDRVRDFIGSITFAASKRPITKRLLQRIDLSAVTAQVDPKWLRAAARRLVLDRGLECPALPPLGEVSAFGTSPRLHSN